MGNSRAHTRSTVRSTNKWKWWFWVKFLKKSQQTINVWSKEISSYAAVLSGFRSCIICGGIAQLARANGSYPLGRWFKSTCRYHVSTMHSVQSTKERSSALCTIRPVGQAVKTPPFHGGIRGSSPLRVTNNFQRRTLTIVVVVGVLLFVSWKPAISCQC